MRYSMHELSRLDHWHFQKTLPSSNNSSKGGSDHEVVAHFRIRAISPHESGISPTTLTPLYIDPLVATTARFTINPDCQWGAIKVHSGHASIHAIASSENHTYDKVIFSSDKTYMKIDQKNASGKKAETTIPWGHVQ